jgi:hypothetical protein
MTTRNCLIAVLLALTIGLMPGTMIIAAAPQNSGQSTPKAEPLPAIAVRVDVMFTRFQSEKKISSLPFSLLASATDSRDRPSPVSIRMGVDVPVGTSTTTDSRTVPAGGNGATQSTGSTSTKVQYRSVGTDIDCNVTRLDENRFSVRVSVSDSSIYAADGDTSKALKSADPAAFRTFSTGNTVVMRDGQTILFGVGTDKISGETLKIEVTLHVVK